MELGSILSLDSLVHSSLENDPMNQKGLFDSSSSLLKHVKSSSEQDDYWSKSLKSAKNDSFNGEQMLSFSSASCNNNNNNIRNNGSLPPYYNPSVASSSAYFYGNGGMNVNMHGAKSPFSPSQWLELEHQAMIYKYIEAKAPIPSHLLFPYRRSIHQSAFSFYPSGSLRSNAFGWGAFNLGFSGNGDPEPGRCRRTDGKKWRCSRNAFADQKYCERHMNRGRHRSRKHVEGQSGQASKPISSVVNSSSAVSTAASGSLQSKNMDQFNRIQMGKEDANSNLQDSQNHPLLTTASSKNLNPFEADFGLASSNFLPNSSRTFHSNSTTQPLHRFIDEWPKTTPTDFSSSSNSPSKETFPLSPLRLSREFGTINEDDDHINVNWAPTSWKPSTVGGPLGEVLNNTNCSTSLYILTDELASPTDVLQKTTFGSVSSSTGSSPRADVNKMSDNNNGMCGAFLGLK